MAIIVSEEQKLTRSVFASISNLRQYAGPLTTRRYAEVPGIGLFEWSYGSDAADDGVATIRPLSGAYGAWLLAQPASVNYPAVRLVSTVDVPTLSGLPVVDGVQTVAGDRVLLSAQSPSTENGIYVVAAGAWSRANDMKNGASLALGGMVMVLAGVNGAHLWYMSSPTSGSAVVGSTAITWALAEEAAPLMDVDPPSHIITVAGNKRTTLTGDGSTTLALALASSGHANGGRHLIIVPAGAFSGLASGGFPSNMRIGGDTYVPSLEYQIRLERDNGKIVGAARSIQAEDVTVPTITSATANTANPNAVTVDFSDTAYYDDDRPLPTLTGVALTVTALESGNGSSRFVYTLSGNLDGSETLSIVFPSDSGVQDSNGNLLAPVTEPVDITAEVTFTDTIGFWRFSDVTQSSGVATILDLSGNGNTLTTVDTGNRPTYVAADPAINNQPCGDFSTDDYFTNTNILVGGVNPSDYASYSVLIVAKVDNPAGNHALMTAVPAAGGIFSGMNAHVSSNAIYWSAITAFSGGYTSTAWASFEFTHEAAAQAMYVDGTLLSQRSIADNVPALKEVSLGAFLTAGYPFDGRIAEMRIIGHRLTAPELADWAEYLSLRYGL